MPFWMPSRSTSSRRFRAPVLVTRYANVPPTKSSHTMGRQRSRGARPVRSGAVSHCSDPRNARSNSVAWGRCPSASTSSFRRCGTKVVSSSTISIISSSPSAICCHKLMWLSAHPMIPRRKLKSLLRKRCSISGVITRSRPSVPSTRRNFDALPASADAESRSVKSAQRSGRRSRLMTRIGSASNRFRPVRTRSIVGKSWYSSSIRCFSRRMASMR